MPFVKLSKEKYHNVITTPERRFSSSAKRPFASSDSSLTKLTGFHGYSLDCVGILYVSVLKVHNIMKVI